MSFRVLVTGGAGYIGSHVVWALRDANEDVVVVDDLSAGYRKLLPSDAQLEIGDCGDSAFMRKVFTRYRPDAVMHFAGSILTEESIRRPVDYYRNNTLGSLNLIESCLAAGIHRLIFSSSAAVYGDAGVNPIREDAVTTPLNPYGWSKLMTERMLIDASAATPLRYGILRYFNVAGADEKLRSGPSARAPSHLMRVASKALVGAKKEVAIYGTDYETPDGTCVRDYVHVSDLADAHIVALRFLSGNGESFTCNVGYGHGYSVREVLAQFQDLSDGKLVIRESPRRAGDGAILVADPTRIRVKLGWRPTRDDLALIARSALDWERRMLDEPLE